MLECENRERIDVLKGIDYKIIQDSKQFCFGIDAVLISHYAMNYIKTNHIVYDLGCGNGIIPLLIYAKCTPQNIYGVEIQAQAVNMARRSVSLNGLDNKISILHQDIKTIPHEPVMLSQKHKADIVISNPPYMIAEHGKVNPNTQKQIARHEILCTLDDVIAAADFLLKPKGNFFMIHRPFRLAEIISKLTVHHLEPKRMQLIQPFENEEPNIVMIQAVKNANSRLTVDSTLNVYGKDGNYSERVTKIYNTLFSK